MIDIRPFRTKRITADLRELGLGDAVFLCKIPLVETERGTGELLKRIVLPVEKPYPGQETSPRLWTVQERAFLVAHYLAHIVDGGPDFQIGDDARYSDYLQELPDSCEQRITLGVVGGETWCMRPLLGGFSESIERLMILGELPQDHEGWLIGSMAAQVFRIGDDFDLESSSDAAVDEYVTVRVTENFAMPESEWGELLDLYLAGRAKLEHIFQMEFADEGPVWLPKVAEGGPVKPPARFPFSKCVRGVTERIFGLADRAAGGSDVVLPAADGVGSEDDPVGHQADVWHEGLRKLEKGSRP